MTVRVEGPGISQCKGFTTWILGFLHLGGKRESKSAEDARVLAQLVECLSICLKSSFH